MDTNLDPQKILQGVNDVMSMARRVGVTNNYEISFDYIITAENVIYVCINVCESTCRVQYRKLVPSNNKIRIRDFKIW